jgi:TRAP-type C4-dicarboxylate transport system permease small subunit
LIFFLKKKNNNQRKISFIQMMIMMMVAMMMMMMMMMITGSGAQGSEATDQTALLAMKAEWSSSNGLTTGWTVATLPCTGGWYFFFFFRSCRSSIRKS